MKKIAALALAPALAVTLAFGSPAEAATKSFKDEVGDAPAKFDLTRVKVKHTKKKLVITSKVRNLRKKDAHFYSYYCNKGNTRLFTGTSHRTKGGKVTETWYDSSYAQQSCSARTKWMIKKNTIRTVVPRSCVTTSGALHVRVSFGPGTKNGDVADLTKFVKVAQG